MGVISSAAAVLLSAGVAFAQEQTTAVAESGAARPIAAPADRSGSRQNAQERIQAARAEAQERVAAQREKAAERLAAIQDKTKQQMAKRIAERFENLNKVWTDHFARLLDRYGAVVEKMKDRSGIAAAAGKDVAAANTAIQTAEAAIATARTAVATQAAKTYVLDTSAIPAPTASTTPSEQAALTQNLRSAFKKLHDALFKDLFALRDGAMTDARKAVQNALQELGKIPGVDEGAATSTSATTAQ